MGRTLAGDVFHTSRPVRRLGVSGVVGAVLVLLVVSCGQKKESAYANLAAVRESGDAAHGWLPSYLPLSATSLQEAHYVDSTECLVAFRWDAAEPFIQDSPCVPVAEADVPSPPRVRGVSWCPENLLSTRRGGLRLFRCTEPSQPGKSRDAWLALDVARGDAFFWRGGEVGKAHDPSP